MVVNSLRRGPGNIHGLIMGGKCHPDDNVTSSVFEPHGIGRPVPFCMTEAFITAYADLCPHRLSINGHQTLDIECNGVFYTAV